MSSLGWRQALGLCVALLVAVFTLHNFAVFQLYASHERRSHKPLHAWDHENHHATHSPVVKHAKFHVVYNIGCGGGSMHKWQLMQALILEASWVKVQQHGRITRLVSGCHPDQGDTLGHQVHELITRNAFTDPEFSDRWDVAFAPRNDTLPSGKVYVMMNRPTALLHWLEKTQAENPDTIFCVVDPDFMFRKRIGPDVYAPIVSGKVGAIAQHYEMSASYMAEWGWKVCDEALLGMEFDGVKVQDCSFMKHFTRRQVSAEFTSGVPYITTGRNLRRLMMAWIHTIPPTQKYYSRIESDMFAYAIAGGALKIKHKLSNHFMRTCMKSDDPKHAPYHGTYFLHYCQRYGIPEPRPEAQFVTVEELFPRTAAALRPAHQYLYVFNKHWLKSLSSRDYWIVDCNVPLLLEPPVFSTTQLESFPALYHKHYDIIHEVVPLLNDAMIAYKQKYCTEEEIAHILNSGERLVTHETHRATGSKLNRIIVPKRPALLTTSTLGETPTA